MPRPLRRADAERRPSDLPKPAKPQILSGVVNLTATAPNHNTGHILSCLSDFRPQAHRCCTQFAMMAGGDVVAPDVEQVGNWVMDGDDALWMSL